MNQPTVDEVISALAGNLKPAEPFYVARNPLDPSFGDPYVRAPYKREATLNERMEKSKAELIGRIREHGIAPPEGYAIVPIITEATPFSCGINGDPPQVDNAWTPPCKVWCGRKQCAAKESP